MGDSWNDERLTESIVRPQKFSTTRGFYNSFQASSTSKKDTKTTTQIKDNQNKQNKEPPKTTTRYLTHSNEKKTSTYNQKIDAPLTTTNLIDYDVKNFNDNIIVEFCDNDESDVDPDKMYFIEQKQENQQQAPTTQARQDELLAIKQKHQQEQFQSKHNHYDRRDIITELKSRYKKLTGEKLTNHNVPANDNDASTSIQRKSSNINNKASVSASGYHEQQQQQYLQITFDNNNDLAARVKKRLSLPNNTSIPDSFLLKHAKKDCNSKDGDIPLFSPLNSDRPLSRLARRQSLSEIGFGQLSSYFKLNVLGSGTYSTVFKGTSRLANKLVALKEIRLEQDEGVPFTAIREVSLLKELKHNNIITLHDIIYTRKTLTLVFEFVDRDLSKYMDECDHKININNVKLFLFQLLRGLKYCHDRRILHRDLKPQNILINLNGDLKLADFGLARAKSVPTKTFTDEVVTLWYRPPDVLLGNIDYGTSIDIWGVGCIFFEMIAGHTLFTGTNPKKQIECIFEIIGTPNDDDWPSIKTDLQTYSSSDPIRTYTGIDLRTIVPRSLNDYGLDLLINLLKCNPRSRISAQDAMLDKYFSNLPSEIYKLPDHKSIFTIKGINLIQEIKSLKLVTSTSGGGSSSSLSTNLKNELINNQLIHKINV